MSLAHMPSDDVSLQRWGRNLRQISPAIEELAARNAALAAESEQTAAAVLRMAQQADSDLPASNVMKAEMESVATELRQIATEEAALAARRRALARRAETLPGTYAREHETDEDRLLTPRNGRHAERRADVSAAEQDT